MYETIEQFWEDHHPGAERIVVDIPIGLCTSRDDPDGCVTTDGELSRRCDDLARQVLGSPRSSSVFTAPCREAATRAAEGVDHSEVTKVNNDRTGKGLMQQAANIAPEIIEVDDLLLNGGDRLDRRHRRLPGRPEQDPELLDPAITVEPLFGSPNLRTMCLSLVNGEDQPRYTH